MRARIALADEVDRFEIVVVGIADAGQRLVVAHLALRQRHHGLQEEVDPVVVERVLDETAHLRVGSRLLAGARHRRARSRTALFALACVSARRFAAIGGSDALRRDMVQPGAASVVAAAFRRVGGAGLGRAGIAQRPRRFLVAGEALLRRRRRELAVLLLVDPLLHPGHRLGHLLDQATQHLDLGEERVDLVAGAARQVGFHAGQPALEIADVLVDLEHPLLEHRHLVGDVAALALAGEDEMQHRHGAEQGKGERHRLARRPGELEDHDRGQGGGDHPHAEEYEDACRACHIRPARPAMFALPSGARIKPTLNSA